MFVGVVEPSRELFNIVDISIGRVEARGMIASSAEREEEKNTSIVSTCMASAWGGGLHLASPEFVRKKWDRTIVIT